MTDAMNEAQDKALTLQVECHYLKNSGEIFIDIYLSGSKGVLRLNLEQAKCLSQCLQDGIKRLNQLGFTDSLLPAINKPLH